jgi:hypothetical protein
VRLGRRSLGGGAGEARCDQDGGDVSGFNHFDNGGYEAGNSRPIATRPEPIPRQLVVEKIPLTMIPREFLKIQITDVVRRRQDIDRLTSFRGYCHQLGRTRTMVGSFCIVLQICSC